jgi:hypothetical protein
MRSSVPFLEPLLGGLWWTVGAIALSAGLGTVVLAAGIGVTGGLIVALRSRYGNGEPLPRGGRGRLIRIAFVVVVLCAAAGPLLGLVDLGELAVPVACAVTGFGLFPGCAPAAGRGRHGRGGRAVARGRQAQRAARRGPHPPPVTDAPDRAHR